MLSSASPWGFVEKRNKLKNVLHLLSNMKNSTKMSKNISIHFIYLYENKCKNVNVKTLFRLLQFFTIPQGDGVESITN